MIKKLLTISILLLISCANSNTPSKVADNFWKAVASKDVEAAKELVVEGTMENTSFSKDAELEVVGIGKEADIENEIANVDTEINVTNKDKTRSYKFETVLVKEDNLWKVDFDKTMSSMIGFSMKQLEDSLKKAGKEMGEAVKEAGRAMGEAIEQAVDKTKDAMEK